MRWARTLTQLDVAFQGKQDIIGFDITMDDAFRM
jgi:hypothetical protein